MTCDDADLLLAAHALGTLEPDEQPRLRAHLIECATCRAAGAGYLAAADLLPLAVDLMTPPPALRSRIMARVHAEAAGERPRRPSLLERLWQSIPSGRGVTLAGAGAAAVALVAVGLGIHSTTQAPRPPAQAAFVQRACGTTAVPTACGSLTVTPSIKQAVLTVKGLPVAPSVNGGSTGAYEVWLIRPNGSAQPAAYLTLGPDMTTWSAAIEGDLSQYRAVATTSEPPGGSAQPTGTEVFRVNLDAPAS